MIPFNRIQLDYVNTNHHPDNGGTPQEFNAAGKLFLVENKLIPRGFYPADPQYIYRPSIQFESPNFPKIYLESNMVFNFPFQRFWVEYLGIYVSSDPTIRTYFKTTPIYFLISNIENVLVQPFEKVDVFKIYNTTAINSDDETFYFPVPAGAQFCTISTKFTSGASGGGYYVKRQTTSNYSLEGTFFSESIYTISSLTASTAYEYIHQDDCRAIDYYSVQVTSLGFTNLYLIAEFV